MGKDDVVYRPSSSSPTRSALSAPGSSQRLSNARVEAINIQIRLITRRAFGFHSPGALIAPAMLALADLCPPLPR
jgi:hypothetical protein